MSALDQLLERLEAVLEAVDALEPEVRDVVFELLDGLDAVHRMALTELVDALEEPQVERLRAARPEVAWLLDAYGFGGDQREVAEEALESIRPYIDSHGGRVDVLDAADGVVHVRMAGACSGCSASAVTLTEGVEEALRSGVPGFARMEVEEDHGTPHPPPGQTLVQIGPRPAGLD